MEQTNSEEIINSSTHMFSNRELTVLLAPLVAEQLLNVLMGMIDTVMVSNVGSAAISAVSLVDSINILIIQVLSAIAAGGTICCGHYIGSCDRKAAENSAKQLILVMLALSMVISGFCLVTRGPLLMKLFGEVEDQVMSGAQVYFFYTLLSFPFVGLYNAGSAVMRAAGDSKLPFKISVVSNVLNIIGNAFCIWGLGLGVKGAAIATLGSRAFLGIVIMLFLRKRSNKIAVRNYLAIRPDTREMKRILFVGVPNGVEGATFQLGKILIQSYISVLPTYQLAAHAMASVLENFNGVGGVGVGMGMMTVVSQCLGAGRDDEAVYYTKKLWIIGEIVVTVSCFVILGITWPVTRLGGMEAASASLCIFMMTVITVYKPFVWATAYIPAYGMRSAGDVNFSMITSISTMWIIRVVVCIFLLKFTNLGIMAFWYSMFTDWSARAIIFGLRFRSRKWLRHKVV